VAHISVAALELGVLVEVVLAVMVDRTELMQQTEQQALDQVVAEMVLTILETCKDLQELVAQVLLLFDSH